MARIAAQPVEWEAPKSAEQLPKLRATPPFRLTYHPTRWGWHPTRNRWYPILGSQNIDPGVGGIDEHGRTALADVALKERGWTILPVPTSEYLAAFAVQGGKRHVTKWQSIATAGHRAIEEVDEDGYYAWIDSLIARKILPAEPDDHVKDFIFGKTRDVAGREADRAKRQPSAASHAEVLSDAVEAMEQARAGEIQAAVEGKPSRKAKDANV